MPRHSVHHVHLTHEQVGEDGDRDEDAAMGGMSAEEEREVAQKAEQHDPDHVQLEEVVEAEEPTRHSTCMLQVGWQSEPPEEAAAKTDGKEQPDLVKALLGSRQETVLQELLEKLPAAEGGHCGPPGLDEQMTWQ